jgi:osmotically-inducible protein OsmY
MKQPGAPLASASSMRLLTLLAVAAVAAGVYHYRSRLPAARRRPAGPGVSDELLAERVRSGIAGAASSPVDVRCINGIVSLRGTVRRAERDLVLAAALAVPGVTQVTNFLETDEPVGDLGPMQSGIASGV